MQYKVISKGVKYKVMKSALAYKPLIYKAVIIVLTIKMPDGSVLANKHVTINGNTYMTNASGRVSITDDMGLSVTYRVKYNDLYYTDIAVTYTANASYNVTLEQHVAAGSVTINEWAFSSTSSYAKKPYTLVVPPVVTVVKMSGSKRNSGKKVKAGYVGTNGEAIANGDVEIAYLSSYGDKSFEKYVGVTPGETYTIYGRNVADGATIEWSDEINTHAVDVTI